MTLKSSVSKFRTISRLLFLQAVCIVVFVPVSTELLLFDAHMQALSVILLI